MQTGYNKLNITPKKAVRIAGYNRKELSKLLKEDNPNKNIRYIIVEKANGK